VTSVGLRAFGFLDDGARAAVRRRTRNRRGRTRSAILAYVAIATTASILAAPDALRSPAALALFAVATTISVILAPVGIVLFVRANPAAGDLRPAIALPLRLLLAIGFALLRGWPATMPRSRGPGDREHRLRAVVRPGDADRPPNLIAQMIGLLMLGAAMTLAGAELAPQLPASFELGATFDAFVATLIGLALVRSIVTHHPSLDSESLRGLRG